MEDELVRWVARLAALGRSPRSIARELGLHRGAVGRALARRGLPSVAAVEASPPAPAQPVPGLTSSRTVDSIEASPDVVGR